MKLDFSPAKLSRLWQTSQGRDWLLALVLVGLMFLIVWLSVQQDAGDETLPRLTSHSTAPDGALALALWLEDLGYAVRRIEGVNFRFERADRLLFVLSPQYMFSPGELEQMDNWIAAGGTLLLATDDWRADPLLAHFDLDVGSLNASVQDGAPAHPLLLDPPWSQAKVQADRYLDTTRDDVVVLMTVDGRPALLSFEHRAGRVFVAAVTFPFTNAGLREPGNARLVHNLMATVDLGAQVVFDEFHHGYQTPRTLSTWLRSTPQGRSLIYAGLVIFVYLLVGGRRLGRSLSSSRMVVRRAPIEHIQAMANLFRRGGKRTAILYHYRNRLKRDLAQPYHLDPTLDDGEFVAQLNALRPDLNSVALSRLLQETGRAKVSEGELIRLAKEVDDWTRKTK